MKHEAEKIDYSGWQLFVSIFLRVLIGWHFLYEGLFKIYTPGWTSEEYLLGAVGPLTPLFSGMAQSETLLNIIDIFNECELIIIGLSLFLGLFSNPLILAGIFLLSLYYLSYPLFPGLQVNACLEGNYRIVNKNLFEMASLFVLFLFPSSHITGFDGFIFKKKKVD